MPIKNIEEDVYNTIRNYNNRNITLYNTDMLIRAVRASYPHHSNQDIGYALQLLKKQDLVRYERRHNLIYPSGWVIMNEPKPNNYEVIRK